MIPNIDSSTRAHRALVTALVLIASVSMSYGLIAVPHGLVAAVDLFSRSESSRTTLMTVADYWVLVAIATTLLLARAVWAGSAHLLESALWWSMSFLTLAVLSGVSYRFWPLSLMAIGLIGVTFAAVQWLRVRMAEDTARA